LLLVLSVDLVQSLDLPVEMVRGQDGQQSRDVDDLRRAEKAQRLGQVFQSASAAAIFIGWYFSSTTPSSLPTNMARMMAGISTASEMAAARRKAGLCCLRCRCQADTASMSNDPVTSEAKSTWG
jgi:hypothetical protein